MAATTLTLLQRTIAESAHVTVTLNSTSIPLTILQPHPHCPQEEKKMKLGKAYTDDWRVALLIVGMILVSQFTLTFTIVLTFREGVFCDGRCGNLVLQLAPEARQAE